MSVRSYAEQGSKSVKRAYIRNETSTHLVDQPAHPSQDKSGLQAQPRFNLPPSLIEVKQQRPTSTRPFESAAMSFVESPTSSFAPGLLPPSCLQRYRDDSSVVAQDEQQLFDSTFQQRHNLKRGTLRRGAFASTVASQNPPRTEYNDLDVNIVSPHRRYSTQKMTSRFNLGDTHLPNLILNDSSSESDVCNVTGWQCQAVRFSRRMANPFRLRPRSGSR